MSQFVFEKLCDDIDYLDCLAYILPCGESSDRMFLYSFTSLCDN